MPASFDERRWRMAVGVAAAVMAFGVVPSADAFVQHQVYAGFTNAFDLLEAQRPDPRRIYVPEFSYRGALCPAAGTPNYLCGRAEAATRLDGGRLSLKAEIRLKRTNAQPPLQTFFGYAGGSVLVGLDGWVLGPVPAAHFVFGLSGTIVNTTTDPNVATVAKSVVNLYAGDQTSVQCVAPTSCLPSSQQTLRITNWDPADGFMLALRSDVSMDAPQGSSGYDVEVVADFSDTLELLAIQLLDANDDPIPGVTLSFTDAQGTVYVVPDTPPDPTSTSTPTPAATPSNQPTATGGAPAPTPTATPVCASPPCEDCDNCIDDDADGLVDRRDADCAPPSNGSGAGLPDLAAAKALDKCAKAIAKAADKLAAARFTRLGACVKAVAECVQAKPDDAGCLAKAAATCTKARAALADVDAKAADVIGKACGDPSLTVGDLAQTAGLGFEDEEEPCARRGVPSLAAVSDVAACVQRQQACAAERMIGFAAPRAGALLALGGWNPPGSCLAATGVGGEAGLVPPQKALRKCDEALQKATAKLASGRAKAGLGCTTALFTCVQTKPGDAACIEKASEKCTKSLTSIPDLENRFALAIGKACGVSSLSIDDLRAPAGLGLGTLDGPCALHGVASLTSLDAVARCLAREVACRVEQRLENAAPRLRELLQAAGTSLP
jgi:hypothetical protein